MLLFDKILSSPQVKIRKLSQLLGKFSNSFIAVPQGKLYYRPLKINKTNALMINKGNFDNFLILSKESKANIYWWKSNIMDSFTPIFRSNPSMVLSTDVYLAGWRVSMTWRKTGAFLIWGISAAHNYFRTQSCIIWIESLV